MTLRFFKPIQYITLLLLLLLLNDHHPKYCCYAFTIGVTTKATTTTKTTKTTTTSSLNAFSVTDAIEGFYMNQPYLSAFLTCAVKGSAADFLAQQQQQQGAEENNNNNKAPVVLPSSSSSSSTLLTMPSIDISRNLAFLFYGGIYQGLCQQFMYNTLFPSLFGNMPQSTLVQVGFDMAIIGPFICLPIAYLVKSFFCPSNNHLNDTTTTTTNHDLDEDFSIDTCINMGLEQYVDDVIEQNLLFKYWTLWIPVQTLTFGIIPQHFRIVFVAAVSFFWIVILSSVSGNNNNNKTSTITSTTKSILTEKTPTSNIFQKVRTTA